MNPAADPVAAVPRPLLVQRDFGALWWGQLISILGDRLNYLALLGLIAHHTDSFRGTGASLLLTMLANVMLIPVLLFAPFTGAWLDRLNLRRVLIVSDLLRALVVAAIPFLYSATHAIAPVFVAVFVLFVCNVFFLPAKSALTPELVPAPQLMSANALLSAAGIAATAIGALAGGWVVDHWGWEIALWIDAGTYVVSVVTIVFIRYQRRTTPTDGTRVTLRGYLTEVGEGWRVVRENPAVRLAMLALGAVWIGGGFLHVAGNQHIQQRASIPGMERVGVLMAALGLGSALGTLWVNQRARHVPPHRLLGAGLACASLALAGFAFTRLFAIYAGAAFVIGFCIAPVFVLTETLLQRGVDLNQRARVFSARDFMMRLAFMIAVAVAGTVTRADGTAVALLVSAGLLFVIGILTLGWRGLHADHGAPLPDLTPRR
jgi:predicted MFS family arabinose efflux permease